MFLYQILVSYLLYYCITALTTPDYDCLFSYLSPQQTFMTLLQNTKYCHQLTRGRKPANIFIEQHASCQLVLRRGNRTVNYPFSRSRSQYIFDVVVVVVIPVIGIFLAYKFIEKLLKMKFYVSLLYYCHWNNL